MKQCFMTQEVAVSSNVSTTSIPLVLTAKGREVLQARLDGALRRLERIEDELRNERDESLIAEQRQLRQQVDELGPVLRDAVSPSEVIDDPTIVELGDEVEVEFPDGSRERFLVVHPLEAGIDEQRTSAEAPVADAVLGHREGDRVTVTSPAGVYHCTIRRRRRSG